LTVVLERRSMDRRTYLAALGLTGLAGCASLPGMGDGESDSDDQPTASPTPTPSPTASPTPTPTPTAVPTPTPFPFRQTNPWFEPDSNEFESDYSTSGGARLQPGEFGALSWSSDASITIGYAFAVRDDRPIDALLMSSNAYDSFIDTRSAGILADGSVLEGASGEVEIQLGSGTYYLVFDNSIAARARPEGEVELVYGARTG
jgi:poly(beta-D-mannuronate) lyase